MTERPGVERIARVLHEHHVGCRTDVARYYMDHHAQDAAALYDAGLRVADSPELGLDVERLARALHAECVMVPAPYRPEGSAHPSHIHTEEARVAAAEYERLREESAET